MPRPRSIQTAAILANGRLGNGVGIRARLRRAGLLICADGGLRAARRLRVQPDVAIGDFDSASPALRGWAVGRGARIVSHPVEKDKTDVELAVDYAAAHGIREVELFGALGGRLDHQLANVALLLGAKARRVRLQIIDGRTVAFLAAGRTSIPGRPGDLVSLLPLSRTVSGVSTRGLKYALRRATLREGSSLGVSNEVISQGPAVTVGRGDLLVVVTHRSGARAVRRS